MKQLLTEFYALCPGGHCPDLLTEREKREVSNGATYLSGRIQAADTPNGNGRVYPKKILEREVKALQPAEKAVGKDLDAMDGVNCDV